MSRGETHGLGYQRVDDDPNVSVLLATMNATAGWEAARRLRRWERDQLRLVDGQRLLDVGCGLGEAALDLAQDLGEHGEVVGVDLSSEMVRAAQATLSALQRRVRFSVGDACALDEPDDWFDVVRSERTLQWLPDPAAAVAEMARVVRPGGRISLIDTDWSTFAIDVGDEALAARIRNAMRPSGAAPPTLEADSMISSAALVSSRSPALRRRKAGRRGIPTCCPHPMGASRCRASLNDLVAAKQLEADDRDRFVSTIHEAALRNQFSMTLMMYAVVAAAPVQKEPTAHAVRSRRPRRPCTDR